MPFLCLVHVDSEREAAMTPAERAQFDADNQAYADWLFATGHVPMGGALHEPPSARLIRERSGRLSMTDGPYVETKEHVAGFIVIVADSLEAATEIVVPIPGRADRYVGDTPDEIPRLMSKPAETVRQGCETRGAVQ